MTQFSLANTCAYAYALVKTGLKKGLIRQANKTSVFWRITNRPGLMMPAVYPFYLPTWTLQGLVLATNSPLKIAKISSILRVDKRSQSMKLLV